MEASTAALRKGTSDFMGWWLGELSALVPTPLRHALKPAERTIAVTIHEDRISLTKIEGGDTEPLGQFATKNNDFGASSGELDQFLTQFQTGRWRWGLYLRGDAVLRDRLHLPIAAKENFYEAVEFQVERQTPFQRSEIYFDCRPIATEATSRTLCVDYIIAPLERVDNALRHLTSLGIPVDFVTTISELSGDQPRFNLLSDHNPPRRHRGARLNAGLGILAVLLGGAVIFLTLDNDRRQAAALTGKVESLRSEARVASQLQNAIETEQRSANYVLNLKQDNKSVIQILNNLTRLVPDDAWVSRFNYKDGKIQIVIHAPESSSIVQLVEGSDQFSEAKMMTAVRKDKNTNRERFTLSFSAKQLGDP
jgi:general secretion pathway protein L